MQHTMKPRPLPNPLLLALSLSALGLLRFLASGANLCDVSIEIISNLDRIDDDSCTPFNPMGGLDNHCYTYPTVSICNVSQVSAYQPSVIVNNNVVEELLALNYVSEKCRRVIEEIICRFYYPPCEDSRFLCQEICVTVMTQCSEDWERIRNKTIAAFPSEPKLHFPDCSPESLVCPSFQQWSACCANVDFETDDDVSTSSLPSSSSYHLQPSPQTTTTTTMMTSSNLPMLPPTGGDATSQMPSSPLNLGGIVGGSVVALLVLLVVLAVMCVAALYARRLHALKRRRLALLDLPPPIAQRSAASLRKTVEEPSLELLMVDNGVAMPNSYSNSLLSGVQITASGGRMVKVPSTFLRHVSGKMLIPGSNLTLLDCIGQGEFGIVCRASLAGWGEFTSPVTVAAKTLKNDTNIGSLGDMLEESLKMRSFDHPNVLGLIGVCLELGPAPYIITKYMSNGSLLNFLKKERHSLTVTMSTTNPELITDIQGKLLPMCLQIAKGMEYLADKKFVHRDLAARNCMIDEKYNIKVADFGLSEDVYAKNYFRQDKFDNSVKLPFKWMALESLHDGIFTEKTDVWSYGVTCWEVFTCGRTPYPAVDPLTLVKHLEAGRRLDRPKNEACSDEIYKLMMNCWLEEAEDRHGFTEIVSTIERILETIAGYMDFGAFMAKACVPTIEVTDVELEMRENGDTLLRTIQENGHDECDQEKDHVTSL